MTVIQELLDVIHANQKREVARKKKNQNSVERKKRLQTVKSSKVIDCLVSFVLSKKK